MLHTGTGDNRLDIYPRANSPSIAPRIARSAVAYSIAPRIARFAVSGIIMPGKRARLNPQRRAEARAANNTAARPEGDTMDSEGAPGGACVDDPVPNGIVNTCTENDPSPHFHPAGRDASATLRFTRTVPIPPPFPGPTISTRGALPGVNTGLQDWATRVKNCAQTAVERCDRHMRNQVNRQRAIIQELRDELEALQELRRTPPYPTEAHGGTNVLATPCASDTQSDGARVPDPPGEITGLITPEGSGVTADPTEEPSSPVASAVGGNLNHILLQPLSPWSD